MRVTTSLSTRKAPSTSLARRSPTISERRPVLCGRLRGATFAMVMSSNSAHRASPCSLPPISAERATTKPLPWQSIPPETRTLPVLLAPRTG